MAVPQINENDVANLLSGGDLVVSGKYSWLPSGNKSWFKAEIPVKSDKRQLNLKIVITVNRYETSVYSFALIFNNAFRIRGLDVNGSHSNKHTNTEKWVAKIHKHKWTNPCRDRLAYTPTDITAVDIYGKLKQFCAECGLQCSAELAKLPPLQETMFDEI